MSIHIFKHFASKITNATWANRQSGIQKLIITKIRQNSESMFHSVVTNTLLEPYTLIITDMAVVVSVHFETQALKVMQFKNEIKT